LAAPIDWNVLDDPSARLSSLSSATSRPSTALYRNYLKGRLGDHINAVLAAAGHNFDLLLRWLAELLRLIIRAFIKTVPAQNIA